MRPHLKLQNVVGLVCDGNSLMVALHPYISGAPPVAGSGCSFAAVPIAGQRWTDMRNSAADVDAALLAAGDFAALLLWEHTNQLNGGASIRECKDEMLYYVEARRKARPDVRVLVMETLPREGLNSAYHTLEQYNVKLQAMDEWCWENSGRYDWEFVSIRVPGSPFRFTEFTTATFDSTQAFWNETAGTRVHCTPAGYQQILPEVRKALHRVRAR